MDRVKDKIIIVTGSARGLGRTQVEMLAKEGASVVVTDIMEREGEKVVETIKERGGEALFLKQDVTQEDDWQAVMDRTLSVFERLDVLVNNAGVFLHKPIEKITLEEWQKVMRVNLDGVFLGTKHAIRTMKKSRGGAIVNISSIAGFVGMQAETSAYIASKGAVRLFTKAAAIECSKKLLNYNIRVNSVHPGFIMTEMLDGIIKAEVESLGGTYEEALRAREDRVPMGCLGDAEDVANAVLFLASDESKYITGTELIVDGGFTAI